MIFVLFDVRVTAWSARRR